MTSSMYGIDNDHVCTVGYAVPFYLIRGTLYPTVHKLSLSIRLRKWLQPRKVLTFTIILEFFLLVNKRIYFIEFISELY